jgi:carbamoyl-phosphate synthase large subunit
MKANVLISSAGRRVALLKCFRDSLAELGLTGKVIAIDASPYAPAGQIADSFYKVPNCLHAQFLSELEAICEREQVDLIVPTNDIELPVYAAAKERLARLGTKIGVSSPEAVEICADKLLTSDWLASKGFSAPRQSFPALVLANRADWTLPLIAKPRRGSASVGLRTITSYDELITASRNSQDLIVQEKVQGREYTVNVFVNGIGKCVCAVPHLRLEIRAGEVSKGVTVRHPDMIELAQAIAEALPQAYGALNLQCFLTPDNECKIIEINARFGGGYPLTHQAGAQMTRWLLEDSLNLEKTRCFEWTDGLAMLRYDEAVFMPLVGLEEERHAYALHSL